jgi:hypothetical protein
MSRNVLLSAVALFMAALVLAAAPRQSSDLDQLMSRVLARRDENWKKIQQYLLDEREEITMLGPSGIRLWGDRRDYTWFIRDGVFVRSPLHANGVVVSETDRRKYEDEFARRAKAREERDKGSSDAGAGGPGDAPGSAEALLTGMRQPQFVDSAYFLRFKFEGGRYAFAGRDRFANKDVLKIEYYPARLFTHEQNDQNRRRREGRRDRNEDVEAAFERMMNKVSLVTLWIEPASEQIVKYTFDNVELDFLPAAWFVRVTDMKAMMTMGEPFAGVWLPNEVELQMGAMFAVGAVDVRYRLHYHNYREATGAGRMISVTPGDR